MIYPSSKTHSSHSTPSSEARDVHLAWVEDWNDQTAEFLITFREAPPPERPDQPREDPPSQLTAPRLSSKASHTTRPGQPKFRFEVFQRYGPQCAVCDIIVLEMLEAAHIRPVEQLGSDDARNGLVLCANHHRAFDEGLFSFDPDSLAVVFPHGGGDPQLLGISKYSLAHLGKPPHRHALAWSWEHCTGRSSKPTILELGRSIHGES